MKKITHESIELFMQKYEKMEEADLDPVIAAMQSEQPDILAYLVESGDELLEHDEQEFLINFGVFLWNLIAKENNYNLAINAELLDEIDKENFDQMNRFEALEEDMFWEEMDALIDAHNQSDVLNVIMEELIDSLEANFVREESFLVIFFMLKTMIESLDRSIS